MHIYYVLGPALGSADREIRGWEEDVETTLQGRRQIIKQTIKFVWYMLGCWPRALAMKAKGKFPTWDLRDWDQGQDWVGCGGEHAIEWTRWLARDRLLSKWDLSSVADPMGAQLCERNSTWGGRVPTMVHPSPTGVSSWLGSLQCVKCYPDDRSHQRLTASWNSPCSPDTTLTRCVPYASSDFSFLLQLGKTDFKASKPSPFLRVSSKQEGSLLCVFITLGPSLCQTVCYH